MPHEYFERPLIVSIGPWAALEVAAALVARNVRLKHDLQKSDSVRRVAHTAIGRSALINV